MLTLYPGLMANMDDGHLIRSLECEPSIMRTPVELELMARCERLAEELAEAHAIAKELTELGQTVANAAAYGREELDQILNPKKEK